MAPVSLGRLQAAGEAQAVAVMRQQIDGHEGVRSRVRRNGNGSLGGGSVAALVAAAAVAQPGPEVAAKKAAAAK